METSLKDKMTALYTQREKFRLLVFVLIAAAVLVAYSNSFTASFHFDDDASIDSNPYIRHVTWDNVKVLLSMHRPVVNLSLMLNYALGGMNVVGWHILNISVHILNSFLLYLFILATLNTPELAPAYGSKAPKMALFGALLFAVHPIQTEAVTYIIQRAEVLAAFFYLLAFLLFIRGAQTKNVGYYAAAGAASFCSMASKEWAVTLPAMILLYDFLFLSGRSLKPVLSRWFAYIMIALPWWYILSSTELIAKSPAAGGGGGAAPSFGFGVQTTTGITPYTYLLTSCNVIWTYLRLLVLPIHQNLDYDYRVAKTVFEFPTILSVLGHLAVIGAGFWLFFRKKSVLLPFSIAWLYVTLSPVQSFVPLVDLIFEHRMYLPSIGFFIAFVVAYEGLFDWIESKRRAQQNTTIRT